MPADLTRCGIVLAGGKSSRMGRDKAALEWRGETLLSRAVRTLTEATAGQVLVSRNGDPDAVPDREPALGPLGGLWSVARSGRLPSTAKLIVMPVDMPWLEAGTLARLLEAPLGTGPGASRARRFAGFEMPFAFLLDSVSLALLERMCRPGTPSRLRSVGRFLEVLVSEELSPPKEPGSQFRNLNHAWEWEVIRHEHSLQ